VPGYECIKVESDDRVTTVTFNRPHKRNGIAADRADELGVPLARLGAQAQRVVAENLPCTPTMTRHERRPRSG
jgi:enoyl-CoA hydratase/carnithine racemase